MSANSSVEFDSSNCTISTCSLEYAAFDYLPSLAGNSLFIAIFSLLLLAQIFLGIRHRTWSFLGAFVGGLVLEIVGYAARIQINANPFAENPFLMYIICLTIAPTFLSAGIYLCLARIVVVYGEDISRFSPRTYTITFITCDIFSLILQAVGGALTNMATTAVARQRGVNIMIAGLASQVASLTLFVLLCGEFAYRVSKHSNAHRPLSLSCSRTKFHIFLSALGLATLTIFVRSAFRVAELQHGFNGALANDEVMFMVLEGAMIITACIALTAVHPGMIFREAWSMARTRATVNGEVQMSNDVEKAKNGVTINSASVV